MKKHLQFLCAVSVFTALAATPVLAGQWVQETNGDVVPSFEQYGEM